MKLLFINTIRIGLLFLIFQYNYLDLQADTQEQNITQLIKNAREVAIHSPRKAYILADSAFRLALKNKNLNSKADALLVKGAAMIELGMYREAIDTLNISYGLFYSFIEKTAIAINLTTLGRAYTQIGMYAIAKSNFKQALDYYNTIDQSKFKEKNIYLEYGKLFNYLGLLNKRINKNEAALNYHLKELKIYQDVNDTLLMGACYGDIGRMYRYMNRLDSAHYYTYKGYEIVRKFGNTIYLAHIEKKMGLVSTEMNNYLEAMKYFTTALERYRLFDDQQGLTVCLNHIGRIHSKNSNYPLAQKYFDSALVIAKQNLDIDNLQYIFKFKAEAFKESGDYFNSLDSYLQYFNIKDSVNTAEINRYIQEIEAELALKEKKLNIEKIEQRNTQLFIYSISITTILLLLIIWIFRRNHLRKKHSKIIPSNIYIDNQELSINNSANVFSDNQNNTYSESLKSILGYIRLIAMETKKYNNPTVDSYIDHLEANYLYLKNQIMSSSISNSTISYKLNLCTIDLQAFIKQIVSTNLLNANLYSEKSNLNEPVFINSDPEVIKNIFIAIFSELYKHKTNEISIDISKQENDNSTAIVIHNINNLPITLLDPEGSNYIWPLLDTAKILANIINARIETKTIFGEIMEITVYLHSYDIDIQN